MSRTAVRRIGPTPAAAIQRILVPIDFSPCSRAALDYAKQLADQTHAQVELLYVHESSGFLGPAASLLMPPTSATANQAWEQTREQMLREIDGFVGPARACVYDVHVRRGLPGDLIPEVAREGQFDLIIMGTNGRSGLSRLLVGSVAESVMRKAPVPVLTLRMPRREPREPVPL